MHMGPRGRSDAKMSKTETAYSEDEVVKRLERELPRWRHEGGWIKRSYRTGGWKGTLMVVNTVGHLAEAAWHHPDILATDPPVERRLQTHTAKGIPHKDSRAAR